MLGGQILQWSYTYDNAGNITSKKTYAFTVGTLGELQRTDTYTYGNSWGDLLTNYNGAPIYYDAIGNPTSIDLDTLTWQGRELQSYNDGEYEISFEYNADGIRTVKDVCELTPGVTMRHSYTLSGSRIIGETVYYYVSETSQYEQYRLVYIYDEMGAPIGIKYRTPSYANGVFDCYFFEKNLQGDIVAIYNESGTKIGTYTYDAWGNCTVNPTSGYNFILSNNPFRYRGYYYDTEIGLYYLQSRYYNPTWGRFINADNQIPGIGGAPIGYNLFAYCYNNPTNFIDPTGHWPNWDKLVQGALLTFIGIGVAAATISSLGTMTGPACALGVMVASLVLTASVTTAAIGVSEMGEGLTGTNVISDALGEEKYQEIKDVSLLITTIGASYLAGGGSFDICFIAGTPIATEEGQKAIEDIEVGDLVWATDTETGETALKEVVRLFRNETKEWIHITVNGEKITCTPEHPFYSPVKGWTSAVDLRAGDILVMLNGKYVVVEQVQHELLESPEITYNFEVEEFHTYYAGDTEVLVHNRCGKKVEFDGIPNSTKLKYGNNGKIYSATTYGPDRKIVAKIDFQGTKHYVESVGESILPHVHPYVNNNGYMHKIDAITLEEYIISWGN